MKKRVLFAIAATLTAALGLAVSQIDVYPGQSIQAAVDRAASGDTIVVMQGDYPERVTIAKPLTLRASGLVKTLGFTVTGDDVTISGFDISANVNDTTRGKGIWIRGDRAQIVNNKIHDVMWGGIFLHNDSADSTVSDNYICGNIGQIGIDIRGTNHTVERNEICDVYQWSMPNPPNYADADGMHFHGSGHVIRYNYIHDIPYNSRTTTSHTDCLQTFQVGTGQPKAVDVLVEGNRCENAQAVSGLVIGKGMMVQFAERLTVRNNIFEGGVGIKIQYSNSVVVENNTISGDLSISPSFSSDCLQINASTATISGNLCSDFSTGAIRLATDAAISGNQNTAIRTRIYPGTEYLFVFPTTPTYTASPTLTPSVTASPTLTPSPTEIPPQVLSGGDNAITLNGTADRYHDVTCSAPVSSITVFGAYVRVRDCEVVGSYSHAIKVVGHDVIVENNNVHDSVRENGIYPACLNTRWGSGIKAERDSYNVVIQNNKVYHNCGEGIAATMSRNVIVQDNEVYDNHAVNIYVDNSSDVQILRNQSYCVNKKPHGIAMGEEAYSGWGARLRDIVISNNVVTNCKTGIASFISGVGGTLTNVDIANNLIPSGDLYGISLDNTLNNNVVLRGNTYFNLPWIRNLVGVTLQGNTVISTPTPTKTNTPTPTSTPTFTATAFCVPALNVWVCDKKP